MKKLILSLVVLTCSIASYAQSNNVVIETDSGRIVIALYDNTPLHRDNMIKLVKEKFFDSTLFHRVIPGFVIQGGDPNSKKATPGQRLGEGDLGYKVPAEINDSNYHMRGALGMARDGNPEKASSASQFYIVTGKKYSEGELDLLSQRTGRIFSKEQQEMYKTEGGTPMLDGNYTIYGQVIEGMNVVDKIVNMQRDQFDRPNTDVAMRRVYMMEAKAGKKAKTTPRKKS